MVDANGATDPYDTGSYWAVEYGYDSRGNRTSRTLGTTTGDPVEAELSAAWTQSWDYDLADHLVAQAPIHAVGGSVPGSKTMSYDTLGRLALLQEWDAAGTTVVRSSTFDYWNAGPVWKYPGLTDRLGVGIMPPWWSRSRWG